MSLLERINQKLTLKNKAADVRPPHESLILLLGKKEMVEADNSHYWSLPTRGHIEKIDENTGKALKTIGGQKYFWNILTIPVDLEEYLDIVRKI